MPNAVRKYGVATSFDIALRTSAGAIKTTPTLASGDFKISKNNGTLANLATLPSETPSSSGIVNVALSATEMQAARVVVRWIDQAGAEWTDGEYAIETFGHASAQYPNDSGVVVNADSSGNVGIQSGTGTGQVSLTSGAVTVRPTASDGSTLANTGHLHGYNRIVRVATSGNDSNDGLSLPKLTIASAISVATAGDLILVGPGVFSIGNTPVTLPANVSLRGSGMGATVISGTAQLVTAGQGCLVKPGNYSRVSDLSIVCARTDNTFQACIGWSQVQTAATGVIVERCELIGTTDAAFVDDQSPTATSSIILRDCILRSRWDGVLTRATRLEIERCSIDIIDNKPLYLTAACTGVVTEFNNDSLSLGTFIRNSTISVRGVTAGVNAYGINASEGTIVSSEANSIITYSTDSEAMNYDVADGGTLYVSGEAFSGRNLGTLRTSDEAKRLGTLPTTGTVMRLGDYTAPLDAPGTRAALGMAAADLDQQLDAIAAGGGGGDYGDQLDRIEAQTDKITTSQVNVVNPFKNGTLTLTAGCSYTTAGGNAISIPKPDGVAWPADLTSYTITLHAKVSEDTPVTDGSGDKFTTTVACADPTGAQTLSIDSLDVTTTATAVTGKAYRWEYSIRAVDGSTEVELLSGVLVLKPKIVGSS